METDPAVAEEFIDAVILSKDGGMDEKGIRTG
jgi:hypothetical protein